MSTDSSAGSVMCLLARDRGGPAISHQVLLYPATDMTSVKSAPPDTPFLSGPEMLAFRQHYLGDADPGNSRASPSTSACRTGT